jgi:hypothetical protein
MFSRGYTMVLLAKYKINIPPIWTTFIACALHQSSFANFASNPYCEIYRRFIAILVFFLSHNPKRHLEFLKPAKLMKEKGKKIM